MSTLIVNAIRHHTSGTPVAILVGASGASASSIADGAFSTGRQVATGAANLDSLQAALKALAVETTLSALKARATFNAGAVRTQGYAAVADGGGEDYVWDASETASGNDGSIVKPTSNPAAGRWKFLKSEAYNPMSFGCVGDGSTDDTARLQACFDAAVVDGVMNVFLPGGKTFKITSAIDTQGCSIFGPGATILCETAVNTTSGTPLLVNQGFQSLSGSNFIWEGFTVDGSATEGGNDGSIPIYIQACNAFTLRGLKVKNGNRAGIYIENCDDWRAVENDIRTTRFPFTTTCAANASSDGMYVRDSKNFDISNNVIEDFHRAGIVVESSSRDLSITRNKIRNASKGDLSLGSSYNEAIRVENSAGAILVQGNQCRDLAGNSGQSTCTVGGIHVASGMAEPTFISIVDNFVQGVEDGESLSSITFAKAIQVDGTNGTPSTEPVHVEILDNFFSNMKTRGIEISDQFETVRIANNKCDNFLLSSAASAMILVNEGTIVGTLELGPLDVSNVTATGSALVYERQEIYVDFTASGAGSIGELILSGLRGLRTRFDGTTAQIGLISINDSYLKHGVTGSKGYSAASVRAKDSILEAIPNGSNAIVTTAAATGITPFYQFDNCELRGIISLAGVGSHTVQVNNGLFAGATGVPAQVRLNPSTLATGGKATYVLRDCVFSGWSASNRALRLAYAMAGGSAIIDASGLLFLGTSSGSGAVTPITFVTTTGSCVGLITNSRTLHTAFTTDSVPANLNGFNNYTDLDGTPAILATGF